MMISSSDDFFRSPFSPLSTVLSSLRNYFCALCMCLIISFSHFFIRHNSNSFGRFFFRYSTSVVLSLFQFFSLLHLVYPSLDSFLPCLLCPFFNCLSLNYTVFTGSQRSIASLAVESNMLLTVCFYSSLHKTVNLSVANTSPCDSRGRCTKGSAAGLVSSGRSSGNLSALGL